MFNKMLTPFVQNKKDRSINPVFAIAVTILITIVISTITFLIFLRSESFDLVRLPHNYPVVNNDNLNIDVKNPLSVDELELIRSTSSKELNSLNDDADFSSNDLSDATLGL